jgi:hypothetical protein
MRALSIRQPYAELILRGLKKIKYRSRPTRRYHHRLLVLSLSRLLPTMMRWLRERPPFQQLLLILGVAILLNLLVAACISALGGYTGAVVGRVASPTWVSKRNPARLPTASPDQIQWLLDRGWKPPDETRCFVTQVYVTQHSGWCTSEDAYASVEEIKVGCSGDQLKPLLPIVVRSSVGWPCRALSKEIWRSGSEEPVAWNWHSRYGMRIPNWFGLFPLVGGFDLPMRALWRGMLVNISFYTALLLVIFKGPKRMVRLWLWCPWNRKYENCCHACGYPIGTSHVCTECGEPLRRNGAEKQPS